MSEKKEMSFEDKMKRLEKVVEKVEGGSLPLGETLKLFEEGKALIADLSSTLKEAEKKVGKFTEVEKDAK